MTKLEIAKQILNGCKTTKDVYKKSKELKDINIGIFCDIPNMMKNPRVLIYSLRLGKFHRHLGNKTLR